MGIRSLYFIIHTHAQEKEQELLKHDSEENTLIALDWAGAEHNCGQLGEGLSRFQC